MPQECSSGNMAIRACFATTEIVKLQAFFIAINFY